ncbi:MAG: hypothetical protein IIB95_05565 [Candidatus Marinimicrobia bacterium]|nr:hypothetical protein [Candidatus Neomarinimicrobiota bacterium]MCH7763193.1 hypothetical protein [Candidatus Neomarinimicrobiota bacterium]
MGKIKAEKGEKTIYRYDASAKTFKIAAYVLFGLAGTMVIFSIFWFTQFME